MNVKINVAMIRDLGHLHNVEVKAQEYPVDVEAIKEYINDDDVLVYKAEMGTQNRMVGLLIGKFIESSRKVQLIRVSVHPDFQGNLGVGKALLKKIGDAAYRRDMAIMSLRVPSYKVDDPSDPDYLGGWLDKMGFKAASVDHYQYFRYGREWDGYKMEKML